MFIIIRYIRHGNSPKDICVSDPATCFDVIALLDETKSVNAWQIVDYKCSDFGWGTDGWNKYRPNGFKQEDYT